MSEGATCEYEACHVLNWIQEFQDALASRRAELLIVDAHELQQIDTSDISTDLIQVMFRLFRYVEATNHLKEASYRGSCL